MPSKISKEKSNDVLSHVLLHYKNNQRTLPWRETDNPYHILISEYMLQQTQADRVVPKYISFLKKFPKVTALASSTRKEVLTLWSGLGYNRRATALHDAAKILVAEHDSVVPENKETLLTLPGVGEYTAGAVLAFAYNRPVIIIETNIRTVLLHHCIQKKKEVADKTISVFVKRLLQNALERKVSPRIFYSAMMDYGAHLKSQGVRTNARSKHYTKQSKFDGSIRQARGALLRLFISTEKGISKKQLQTVQVERINEGLTGLLTEGVIEKRGKYYYLAKGTQTPRL